jgi:hypothetical protein
VGHALLVLGSGDAGVETYAEGHGATDLEGEVNRFLLGCAISYVSALVPTQWRLSAVVLHDIVEEVTAINELED